VRIDFEAEIEPFEDRDYATIPVAVIERLGSLDDLAPARDGNIVRPSTACGAPGCATRRRAPSRRSVLLSRQASSG
jgi:hypothetical protein